MAGLDQKELQAVFSENRRELEAMLRGRTRNPDLAADLTQEVFLKLRRITAPLPNRHEARRYLFTMARNLATDHQRVEGRRAQILEGAITLFEDVEPSPEDAAISRDQMRTVELALAELPKHCRNVLYMSRMLGMSHGEIAADLKISKSLVEKYVVKAILHCRERLSPR